MELRRFSQTMASEWQTAFVVSQKMSWCALLTAVMNYNKSLERLQDFFFKTETKFSRLRPRLHDPSPRPKPIDFRFCPRGASRPRPWSRGLHNCLQTVPARFLGLGLGPEAVVSVITRFKKTDSVGGLFPGDHYERFSKEQLQYTRSESVFSVSR